MFAGISQERPESRCYDSRFKTPVSASALGINAVTKKDKICDHDLLWLRVSRFRLRNRVKNR